MNMDKYCKKISDSVLIYSGREPVNLIIRGSKAWDEREMRRLRNGNSTLSFGSIRESNLTKGKSAGNIPHEMWG